MTNGEQRSEGIVDNFRRLGDTALATLQNRVELLAVELAEQKRWLVSVLVWSVAAIFFTGVAVLTITATIATLCPEDARPFVLVAFSVLYSGAAIWAIAKARTQTKDRELPLSSTIAELKKDLASLRSKQ